MKLAPLEKTLGHSFRSPELLERAIAHRSWAHENTGGEVSTIRDADNETLEFVGDSVVGLVIA
jgi:ribonuclease III